MKAIVGDFKCYRKDLQDASTFQAEGESVIAVRFKSGEDSLHLHLLSSDAERFGVGAKYTLTLEPAKPTSAYRKDLQDASTFQAEGESVIAVRFKSGEDSLHLHLLSSDAERFGVGAKYTLRNAPTTGLWPPDRC